MSIILLHHAIRKKSVAVGTEVLGADNVKKTKIKKYHPKKKPLLR